MRTVKNSVHHFIIMSCLPPAATATWGRPWLTAFRVFFFCFLFLPPYVSCPLLKIASIFLRKNSARKVQHWNWLTGGSLFSFLQSRQTGNRRGGAVTGRWDTFGFPANRGQVEHMMCCFTTNKICLANARLTTLAALFKSRVLQMSGIHLHTHVGLTCSRRAISCKPGPLLNVNSTTLSHVQYHWLSLQSNAK